MQMALGELIDNSNGRGIGEGEIDTKRIPKNMECSRNWITA